MTAFYVLRNGRTVLLRISYRGTAGYRKARESGRSAAFRDLRAVRYHPWDAHFSGATAKTRSLAVPQIRPIKV